MIAFWSVAALLPLWYPAVLLPDASNTPTIELAATVVEPGPVVLKLNASGATRAWLHYTPDAGESFKYYFKSPPSEFSFHWPAEAGTVGTLYLVSEDASGARTYSEAVRVISGSYEALLRTAQPDPRLRIEVNLPAFELGVFRGNELLRRFRVAIGEKAWPAPPGLRLAREIVWNPDWLPPESPWVTRQLIRRLRAQGEILGKMKIPLGGEILIHGTDNPRDLGHAVSHGCLRMLNRDISQLANILIGETRAAADPERIRKAERIKRHSYTVALPRPVVVVLRYEPVMLRAGKLAQYPDVYGWSSGLSERVAELRALAQPEAPRITKMKGRTTARARRSSRIPAVSR